jgi:hypothetical protein
VLAVGAAVLAVASPLAYTLASAGVGNAVSASVIAATAVATMTVPLWPGRTDGPEPGGDASSDAVAVDTGRAKADSGGDANTGVRRRRGAGGAARAERTGDAVAQGPGSHANTGVEESD